MERSTSVSGGIPAATPVVVSPVTQGDATAGKKGKHRVSRMIVTRARSRRSQENVNVGECI